MFVVITLPQALSHTLKQINPNKLFKYFIILLFLFSVESSYGQFTMQNVENLELPTNHVYDIVQDENGYMWFASNKGIIKFDGYTSTTFTVKDGLPFNDIFRLEITPSDPGVIWYFASGKYCGYIENDSVHVIANSTGEIINPNNFQFSNGHLWMESSSENFWIDRNGFYKIITEKERYNYTLEFSRRINKELNQFNSPLITFNDKLVLLHCSDDTLYRYEPELEILTKTEVKMVDTERGYFYQYATLVGNIFSGVGFNGIVLYDLETGNFNFHSFPTKYDLVTVKYCSVDRTSDGIRIRQPGALSTYNDNLELIEKIDIPPTKGTHQYWQDRQGNIWIPEYTSGIQIISKLQRQTKNFLEDIKVNKISAFKGEIFADVSDIGYYRMNDSVSNEFARDPNMASDFLSYGDRKTDKDRLLLLSTGTSYELGPDEIRPYAIFLKNGVWQSGLKDIYIKDSVGYGISSALLFQFNANTRKEVWSKKIQGVTDLGYLNNRLYVGGTFGMKVLEGDSLMEINKSRLLETPINNIVQHENFLIVGTDGRGVYLLNEKHIFNIESTNDLIIQKIIPNESNLWLATDKGVMNVLVNRNDPNSSKIVDAFHQSDGLILDNTNDICMIENSLYASCDKGIAKINVNDPIYRRPIRLDFVDKKDTLYFNFAKNERISITFSVIEFVNQKHIKTFYRLDDTDSWTETNRRTLDFYNLEPGMHHLEIKAQDQHYNTSVKRVYIKILPLWWQTVKARVLFVILGVLLLMGLVKITQLRIRKVMNGRIERSKSLYRLELQALRSQMNPHFVHNSLNSIQYYIQRNEVEISENYLEKFSRLIRLFFDYAHLQQITIREEIELLENYLEIEHLRFEDKLEYEISVDEEIDIDEQVVPTMILQPLVENAINHGIFHKPGKGKVSIKFVHNDRGSFSVIVEDNGIGWLKGKEIEMDNQKKYGHNSSAVLRERLKLFEQSGLWQIKYTVQDLSEIGNQTGTQINLRIDDNENNDTISG